MFSDETQIVISNKNRLYKLISQEEAYRLEYVDQHGRNAGITVMFYGNVTYSVVGSQLLREVY